MPAIPLKDGRSWWNAKKGEVHLRLLPYVRTVENFQAEMFDKFVKLAATYDVNPRTNRYTAGGNLRAGLGRTLKAVVTENLIAGQIDTVAANVADTDITVRIQTTGADWAHQRTAKSLEMYVNGLSDLFDVGPKCRSGFKTGAALKGTGFNKVWIDQFDQIQVTPVPVDNIVVDEIEAPNRAPRQLAYRAFFDKEDLQAQFPEYADKIEAAQSSGNWKVWAGYRPMQTHEVVVIHGWRLPIGPKGHERYVPGREALVIDGCDLLDREYDDAYFPFSNVVWNSPSFGFYGISLAERILPHQNLLNRRNYQINRSLDLKADPVTYVHQGDAKLAVQTTNQIGQISVYKVAVPTTVDHQSVGKETYDSVGMIKMSAKEETGVNAMMQHGDVPGGIESGVGVREVRTTRTQRFAIQEKAFERFWLDTLWHIIQCCKKLGGTKAPDILKVTKYGNRRIKWSEVDLDDLKIEMTAASTLGDTPAGRQQRLTELAQAGVITLDESRELMDHPDIGRILSLYNAMIEDIENVIQRIEDGEENVVPEPYQNLEVGQAMLQKEYLRIKNIPGVPESVLEGLTDWIATAACVLNPPPPPQPAGPGMPPPMAPGMAQPGLPGQMPPGAPPMGPGMPQGPAAQIAAAAPTFAPGTFAPSTIG